jgi:DNA polymerase-3 subunit alpha (Gram-positive type)
MERVRKGKGLTDENVELMKQYNVPDWYVQSCNTIKYMFPKAHAVAYVMMSFRIAYFKVHYPLAFYASFFSIKVEDFDAQLICQGNDAVRATMKQYEQTWDTLTKKEQDLYSILEVIDEYYSRGFEFERVNLDLSHSDEFKIQGDKLLPPLRALQGVGETAARKIVEERVLGEFISRDELKRRAKATKTVIEALDIHGCLKGMPENNQLDLFSLA